jgi:hypothetical protein
VAAEGLINDARGHVQEIEEGPALAPRQARGACSVQHTKSGAVKRDYFALAGLTGTASVPSSGAPSFDADVDCGVWCFRLCCRLLLSEGRPGVVASASAMVSLGLSAIGVLLSRRLQRHMPYVLRESGWKVPNFRPNRAENTLH